MNIVARSVTSSKDGHVSEQTFFETFQNCLKYIVNFNYKSLKKKTDFPQKSD